MIRQRLRPYMPRNNRICSRCTRLLQIQSFSTTSVRAKWSLHNLVKREVLQDETPTDEWDPSFRKIKEIMPRKRTPEMRKELRNQIMELVNSAPGGVLAIKYIPTVDAAYSICESISQQEEQAIYRAIAANDPKDLVNFSIVTKLYASFYGRDNAQFVDGIYYLKYLLAQGKVVQSKNLLAVLLKSASSEEIGRGLDELAKCKELVDDDILRMFTEVRLDAECYNKLITLKAEKIYASASGSLSEVISIESVASVATIDTVVVLLDACLTLHDTEAGGRTISQIVGPKFDNLLPKEEAAKLQFLELILSSISQFQSDKQLGERVYKLMRQVPEAEYVKETWEVLAQWMGYQGSLSDVKTIIGEMNDAGDVHIYHADEQTLSGVIKAAKCRDDAFIQQVVDFFNSQLISCNVSTYSTLIERSMSRNDLSAGVQLFNQSLKEGCDWTGHKDELNTLYALLVRSCTEEELKDSFKLFQQIKMFTKSIGYDAQVAMMENLVAEGAIGDACMFLQDEYGDGSSKTVSNISIVPLKKLMLPLRKFIRTTDNYDDAWYLFSTIDRLFSLTGGAYRDMLYGFCRMKRPDAALKIFRSLRNRVDKEGLRPPGLQLYLKLFYEFGQMQYAEGVHELHLYFKMDVTIDADMRVMNSILGAYVELEDNARVMEMWSQLVAFPANDGVDNVTATLMIKHLTRRSIEEVEQFWHTLQEDFKIAPDVHNLQQYIVANCYHGYYLRGLNIAKTMDTTFGIAPSTDLIEKLYNWTMVQSRKDQVAQWAIEQHPEKWALLQDSGRLRNYLLPENTDGSSDEMIRSEAILQLENEVQERNVFVPPLPGQ